MRRLLLVALAAAAVVGLAVVLLPFNDDYYLDWNNYDPQGPEEQATWEYTRAVFTQTTGFLAGQLVCLVLGAALLLHADDAREPRSVMRSTSVLAMGSAVLLALLNLTVATQLALAKDPALHRLKVHPYPTALTDPAIMRATIAALVTFPLMAAVGVGLAAIAGRISRVTVILLGWLMFVPLIGCVTSTGGHQWPEWAAYPFLTLAPPAGGQAMFAWTVWGKYPTGAAVCMVGGALAYAVVLYPIGLSCLRQRRADQGPDGRRPGGVAADHAE